MVCVSVCVNLMKVILCKMLPQKIFCLEKITSINEIIFSFFYKDVMFPVFYSHFYLKTFGNWLIGSLIGVPQGSVFGPKLMYP